MLRAFADEAALHSTLPEFCSISILWGIEGFYDSIQWTLVLEQALQLNFPALPLSMEMLAHMGTRFLREGGTCSDPINPTLSIIAGARSGVEFARAALYGVCQHAHSMKGPVTIRPWADDVIQRCDGTWQRTVLEMARVAGAFAEQV